MWNGTHTKTYNLDYPNYNKMLIYNSLCYFAARVVYARITKTWDKGIYMRVFLFGFLWHSSLVESWPMLVRLILLIFIFIQFYQFNFMLVKEIAGVALSALLPAFLPAPVCMCSWYGFQYILMTWIYRYTYSYPCTPLGICHTTRWGVLTPRIFMSRSQSLKLGDSPGCWSEMRSGSVDHRQTVQSLTFQAPYLALEFFLCDSWTPFVQFMIVYHFVFSHLRPSVM